MSLLDGGLSGVFAKAFAGIYLPATLYQRTITTAIDGDVTATSTEHSCRAQIDSMTEAMRQQAGYADTDRRILILAGTLDVKPSTNDQIAVRGQLFDIASVDSDSALSYWEVRGSRAS